jgi:hypothetical protein
MMGGLPLWQHAQLHGIIAIVGAIRGGGLLLGGGGPLLLLLWDVVVVSRVADIGFIESLRIAHLADPIPTVSCI